MSSSTIDGKSIADAYIRRVDLSGAQRAHLVKKEGQYQPVTWNDIHSQVLGIYASYKKLGIKPGDRVCILSQTRSEWNIIDLANLCLGVVTVPIYQSNLPEEVAYLLNHSGAKLLVLEDDKQAKKTEEAVTQNGKCPLLVGLNTKMASVNGQKLIPWNEFAAPSSDKTLDLELRKAAEAILPDDLATIVYTSGTTGVPKGVALSHLNVSSEVRSLVQEFDFTTDDVTLTFLPFAHILGRVESLMPVFAGLTMAFAEGINEISKNLQEIRPTLLVAVPRIYEKIYTGIQGQIAAAPEFRRSLFHWAVAIGKTVAQLRSEHKTLPVGLMLKYQVADQLVFSKIRAKMGGNLKISVSGGAPLSAELCQFFHGCGIKIVEGYGLTETTGAIAANRPNDYSFGTVGKVLGDTEVRLAPDGEIQVRGSMVFKSYYNNPEATEEAFTADGWFCTGDIGEFSPRGFLKITDRKKELIVTSAGKNVAPQKIENMLKTYRFISQGMVCGDKQKFLTALITLNEGETVKWARSQSISFTRFEDLTTHEQVVSLIETHVKTINGHLASYETIKRFRILPNDFTIEAGELTPSLKLKRKVCVQRYQTYIEEMYS